MSDWEPLAERLAEKFSFTNTYFHQRPRLDLLSGDWQQWAGTAHFVICSEVLEHVLQPLQLALKNARSLLRQDGFIVLSTPFSDGPRTLEHFPGMVSFELRNANGNWEVISKAADGTTTVYGDNIIFHGGAGTVLEMRLFSEADLLELIRSAGLVPIVHSAPDFSCGYFWPDAYERPEAGLSLNFIITAVPEL